MVEKITAARAMNRQPKRNWRFNTLPLSKKPILFIIVQFREKSRRSPRDFSPGGFQRRHNKLEIIF